MMLMEMVMVMVMARSQSSTMLLPSRFHLPRELGFEVAFNLVAGIKLPDILWLVPDYTP